MPARPTSASIVPSSTSIVHSSLMDDDSSCPSVPSTQQQSIAQSSILSQSVNDQSQSSLLTADSGVTQSSASTSTHGLVFLPDIDTVNVTTQSRCFIDSCRATNQRLVIPDDAIDQVWNNKRIFLSKTLRVCSTHLVNNKVFTDAALDSIVPTARGIYLPPTDICKWIHRLSTSPNKQPRVDFSSNDITEDEYTTLVPCSKHAFEEMYELIKPRMRNTAQRTIKNALGMFLMTLRLKTTQKFLAFLFRTHQTVVSEAISSVATLLHELHTPLHLGYEHLPRLRAIHEETPQFLNDIFGRPSSLKIIADATYIDVERPGNFTEQRRTYSLQKKKNLVKPMMLVLGSGRILEAEGPFYSDHRNNDATILEYMLRKEDSGLAEYIHTFDQVIVDRGFRYVEGVLLCDGLQVFMPNLLQGESRTQFTATQANESRRVTCCRYLVEAVNGVLKSIFPFFASRIEAPYKPSVMKFFRVACGIYNAYHRRLLQDSPVHPVRAQRLLARLELDNLLKERIEANGYDKSTAALVWRKADQSSFPDFPRLTMEEIEEFTIGPYQPAMAKRYVEQHLEEHQDFELHVHQEEPYLIRAKLHSRFSGSDKHNTWVEYNPNFTGIQGIAGHYCTCKTGARTAGTCSHVTTVGFLCLEFYYLNQSIDFFA